MKGFGGNGKRRVAALAIAAAALGAPVVAQAAASPPPQAHVASWTLHCGSLEYARALKLGGNGSYNGAKCEVAHEAIRKGSFHGEDFSTPGWECKGHNGRRPHAMYSCKRGSNAKRNVELLTFDA